MSNSRIFFSPPSVDEEDIVQVVSALRNGWIAPIGPELDAFEKELELQFGLKNVLAVNSGTSALHLALHLAGVGVGDRVIVGTFTFVAAANAVLYQGGTPVFMDSESESWNLDPELLRDYLENSRGTNKFPKAVIVTHIFGRPAKIEQLAQVCHQFGVCLIEDAAEALGSYSGGMHLGLFGDFGVLSFNGNKIMTTGGGGALICKEKKHRDKALYLSNQSMSNTDHYEHSELGYNYRLSNILAGLGLGQLKKMKRFLAAKKKIYSNYHQLLESLPFIELVPELEGSNNWIYPVLIRNENLSHIDPANIVALFHEANIEARRFWKPLHMQPMFKKTYRLGSEVSEDLFARGICLPSGVDLTENQMDRIVSVFSKIKI